jgi:hypothetical protein
MHVALSPEEFESSACRLEVGCSGPVELRAQTESSVGLEPTLVALQTTALPVGDEDQK